jgi:uncharacterized protein YecE (DUF72 family)
MHRWFDRSSVCCGCALPEAWFANRAIRVGSPNRRRTAQGVPDRLRCGGPAIVSAAAKPGGRGGLIYFRLHGTPHVYHSEYGPDRLERFARELSYAGKDHLAAWVHLRQHGVGRGGG